MQLFDFCGDQKQNSPYYFSYVFIILFNENFVFRIWYFWELSDVPEAKVLYYLSLALSPFLSYDNSLKAKFIIRLLKKRAIIAFFVKLRLICLFSNIVFAKDGQVIRIIYVQSQ